MLTDGDRRWISEHYPNLAIKSGGEVAGEVAFTATYNNDSGLFLQITPEGADDVGGVRLSGSFRIAIAPRSDTRASRLPALTVEGIGRVADRHFNQSDGSACLCNVLEEGKFLEPQFDFRRYFDRLVIPFLYGQLYFSRENRWPWFDYAHGGLGTIESFSRNPTPAKAEECVQRISGDKDLWKIVRPMLLQKTGINGHALCPCPRRDHLRRCHPVALTGLRLLREAVKTHAIQLP